MDYGLQLEKLMLLLPSSSIIFLSWASLSDRSGRPVFVAASSLLGGKASDCSSSEEYPMGSAIDI